MRPFWFLVPFWGRRYREYFVNYCLPSLLAPNNLPLLKSEDGHVFLIATTADDWQAIEELPIMERLRQYAWPKFLEIPHPQTETAPGSINAIYYLNSCQGKLVEAAYRAKAYGCLLWPDFILSDSMVASLLEHARAGHRLVLAAALRQIEERVVGELAQRGFLSNDRPASVSCRPICVPARVLADLQIRHLHSEVTKFEEGAAGQPLISPFRYWMMPRQNGLLLHSFLMHPMLMDFAAIDHHDTACLDLEVFENIYLGRNFYDCGRLHVVEDSDEFGILSLTLETVGQRSPPRHDVTPKRGAWTDFMTCCGIRASMKAYAGRVKDPVQRDSFIGPVRWHSKDLSEDWYREEYRIAALIARAAGDCYLGGAAGRRRGFLPRWSFARKYFLLDFVHFCHDCFLPFLLVSRAIGKALAGDSRDLKRVGWHLAKKFRLATARFRGK